MRRKIPRLNPFLFALGVGLLALTLFAAAGMTRFVPGAFFATARREYTRRPLATRLLRPNYFEIAITLDPAIKSISGSVAIHALAPLRSQPILLRLSSDLTVDSAY